MQIQIVKQGVELSDTDHDYIEQKLNHLSDFDPILKEESVNLHAKVSWEGGKSNNGHMAIEITLFLPGAVVRAESFAGTAQEAVDISFEKLKRQLDKYSAKRHRRDKAGQWIPVSTLEQISDNSSAYTAPEMNVLRRKKLVNPPVMHEEEALHQLELLDHDFFVYKNVETGLLTVVYRRHKGGYGVLEVE